MATAKTTVKEEVKTEEKPFDMDAYLREKVDFYAFKDNGRYKDDITVGVNGKLFRIKRGEHVMIPRYVRDVIEQSMRQDAKTADLIDAESSAFAAETRFLGGGRSIL